MENIDPEHLRETLPDRDRYERYMRLATPAVVCNELMQLEDQMASMELERGH